jgi:hypothetical protein
MKFIMEIFTSFWYWLTGRKKPPKTTTTTTTTSTSTTTTTTTVFPSRGRIVLNRTDAFLINKTNKLVL